MNLPTICHSPFHTTVLQYTKSKIQFYLSALSLFDGSGSGTIIPDPDPSKGFAQSMPIRIRNTYLCNTSTKCVQCTVSYEQQIMVDSGWSLFAWKSISFYSLSTQQENNFLKVFDSAVLRSRLFTVLYGTFLSMKIFVISWAREVPWGGRPPAPPRKRGSSCSFAKW